MKLNLPLGLRKALLACLTFVAGNMVSLTTATGTMGVGVCFVAMQETASAAEYGGGDRGDEAKLKPAEKFEEDVTVTSDIVISPQGADIEMSGTIDAQGKKITIWNNNENTAGDLRTYTMIWSGELKNLGELSLGGNNVLTIKNLLTNENMQGGSRSFSLVAPKDGKGAGSAMGHLILDGGMSGFDTIHVDKVGPNSSIIVNGTFTGVGSLTKTGQGELALNGAVSGVSNLTLSAGTLSVNNVVSGLESMKLNGGTLAIGESGSIDAKIELTLGSGSYTVEDGGTFNLKDGSSIVVNNDAALGQGMTASGTITKKGNGALKIVDSKAPSAHLVVEQGSVVWGDGPTSTNELGLTEIEVKKDTTFSINHAPADASGTKVTLDGGTLSIAGTMVDTTTKHDAPMINFGKLELKSDSTFEHKGTSSDTSWGISFSELTGVGNLTTSGPIYGVGDNVRKEFRVESIRNYNGTLSIQGAGIDAYVVVGAVHQDKGYDATWQLGTGGHYEGRDFRKTGEGSFTIEKKDGYPSLTFIGSADKDFWMTYEGELNFVETKVNLRLEHGAVMRFGHAENLLSFDSYEQESLVYVEVEDLVNLNLITEEKDFCLEISSKYRPMVKIKGDNKYELFSQDGLLYVGYTRHKDWDQVKFDKNDDIDLTALGDFSEAGISDKRYGLTDDDGKREMLITAENLADQDIEFITGGSAKRNEKGELAEIDLAGKSVTIQMKSGEWKDGHLVGGNYAHAQEAFHSAASYKSENKNGGLARTFNGDVHILLGDKNGDPANQPEVGSIVGGNYGNSTWDGAAGDSKAGLVSGEPYTNTFTGNTYISIYGGQFDWAVGGSYQTIYNFIDAGTDDDGLAFVKPDPTKFNAGMFMGDSYVHIYGLLALNHKEGNHPEHDFVAGGNFVDIKGSLDYLEEGKPGADGVIEGVDETFKYHSQIANAVPFYFEGDSHVVVNLGDKYKNNDPNAKNDNSEHTFSKMIVGGDYVLHRKGWVEHIGNTYVYITGADGVEFTERVVGGNYDDGNSYAHVSGSTNVLIDSGTYLTMVVAGSNQGRMTREQADDDTSFRKVLFSTVENGTYLTITGGRFAGYASEIAEMVPAYVKNGQIALQADGDGAGDNEEEEKMVHSIGRVSVVGGNYLSQAANTTKNLTTRSEVLSGTNIDIRGGIFTGHIVGASVMEGDNNSNAEDSNDKTNQGGESAGWAEGFRAYMDVTTVNMKIANAQLIMRNREDLDSDYAPDIWTPRVVGGYLLHVADDHLLNQLVQAQGDGGQDYKPKVWVGDINVDISNSVVNDVVGGSWVTCLDVSADDNQPYWNYNLHEVIGDVTFEGVKQGNVTVSLGGVTKLTGDVIAGGIQGGITKIVSEATTVNIGSNVEFGMYDNPYRPNQNVITGGYVSARKKDYEACVAAAEQKAEEKRKEGNEDAEAILKWDEEQDPFDTFYEASATKAENKGKEINVSYVKGDRTLNFTDEVNYGDHLTNSILLNFDYVYVFGKGKGKVNAAGLLITDTRDGDKNQKDTIYLRGGGEMQLVPDYMLIPEWITKTVDGTETTWDVEHDVVTDENKPDDKRDAVVWTEKDMEKEMHVVPGVADRYKWLHNNSYIVVQGEGTTLHLLQSVTRDDGGAITMGQLYGDGMLHVQKLRMDEGTHLLVDQYLPLYNALGVRQDIAYQALAVRDGITLRSGSELYLHTNIIKGEMDSVPESAIRGDKDISGVRLDRDGNTLADSGAPVGNKYGVTAEHTVKFDKDSIFSFEIHAMKKDVAEPDYVCKYLIDYVNEEAYQSYVGCARKDAEADKPDHKVDDTIKPKTHITYDNSVTETMEKWFIEFGAYDDWNVGVIQNENGTFSMILEAWRNRAADPDQEPHYHRKRSRTRNGRAGGDLLDDIYPDPPQEGSDRDKILRRVFRSNVDKDYNESDRVQSAVAGSSIPALGLALSDDVGRQLRLMRNRTMGGGVYHEDVPGPGDGKKGITIHEADFFRYNAMWVNGEADYRKMNGGNDGSGYTMNSWGGTLGMARTLGNGMDVGLALTAMYGDFKSDAADQLNADVDTYYLSAFAQTERGKWSHTLVGTVGLSNINGKRTVFIGDEYGSYTTNFSTHGLMAGLMYEAGYTYVLNEERTLFLQPVANISWRHVALDGFTETGSDAALHADDQTMDAIVLGAGARLRSKNCRNMLSRTIELEARALLTTHLGDRGNKAVVRFADRDRRATVHSNERSAVGVELGAGVTIPLKTDRYSSHSLFMDVNTELNAAYSNYNSTVGYKMQF